MKSVKPLLHPDFLTLSSREIIEIHGWLRYETVARETRDAIWDRVDGAWSKIYATAMTQHHREYQKRNQ